MINGINGMHPLNDGSYITAPSWRHVKTGKAYSIFGFSTREDDERLLVHYREADAPEGSGPMWTRPASEFFDGRFVRLFLGRRE